MLGDLTLDFINRDPAVVRAEQILQHFLRRFERDFLFRDIGMGDDAVQRTFQFADIAGDFQGQGIPARLSGTLA
jgi:hypothetical protein